MTGKPRDRQVRAGVGSTHVSRFELSAGRFDALRAVHFARCFPPHFHDTLAIGVIESGAARLHTRAGDWLGGAGSILAFAAGEVHSAAPLGAHGFTYRMMYPSHEFMTVLGMRGAASEQLTFRTPVIHDAELGTELADAHQPLMEGDTRPAAEHRLLRALDTLVRRHAATDAGQATHRDLDLRVVARAREILHERYADRVRLAALAHECGVSAFHLIRVFRRVVGVPPYAYLVQLRVNRAQTMLGNGFSVADVAYSCGFSDQSHLTRTFRKSVGVPPGQYVRSVRRTAA